MWDAIGILHGRGRRFPGTAFDKIAPQRFTAGNRAVMGVGKRKYRQEGNRLAARPAQPAANRNPIMTFIVSLFTTASMTNDGISRAERAAPIEPLRQRPICFQL